MALSGLLTNVANEIGIYAPTTFVGNTADQNATRLLGMARRSGLSLLRVHDWTDLMKTHVFTTNNGSPYDLPGDYERMVSGTEWDRTNTWKAYALTPQEWQLEQSGITGDITPFKEFRLRVDDGTRKFFLSEDSSGDTLAFDYVSNAWVRSGSSFFTDWQTDSDTPLFPEDLIELDVKWRVRHGLGLGYAEERAEYEYQLAQIIRQEQPKRALSGADMSFHMGIAVPEGSWKIT